MAGAKGGRGLGPQTDASRDQFDLFSASGPVPSSPEAVPKREATPPEELDDGALIAALPDGGVLEGPALAREAGRRRLTAAVPALEAQCRRLAGFGVDHVVPEQVASLEALAAIGGPEAGRAVARLIAKGVVQGPTLRTAIGAAAQLGSNLPPALVLGWLNEADRTMRADACRCVRMWPDVVPALCDLLADPAGEVRAAAAFALGRLGRREALPMLLDLLRREPSLDAIEAITPIADEDAVVLLGRIARTRPELAEPAKDALEAIDHPRAAPLLESLAGSRSG